MRLSAPANYDEAILPELAKAGVTELYGKLPGDEVGGGRPDYMGVSLSRRRLASYIQAARQQGIAFNYLLNSACHGNQEWTPSYQRGLNRLLGWVSDAGAEVVTISTPYLMRAVRHRWPKLKIKVGIYAQVDTVKRAQYWADEGADAINLESFSINRDFETLRAIRKAVSCDLVLIANHFCQPNCPYQTYHQVGHAHASGKKTKFYLDWPIMSCQYNRLRKPELFVSAGWIRPEDLTVYEAEGYTTFKLLERNIPSVELLRRARAYHDRRFQGNLAEILLSWGFEDKSPGFSWFDFWKRFKVWRAPLRAAGTILPFMKKQAMYFSRKSGEPLPVVIDSEAIPAGFLDRFLHAPSCLQRDCSACGYCAKVASTAVHIDKQFLAEVLPMYAAMNKKLDSGSLWGIREPKATT